MLGANGAGKSSLLSVLAGDMKPQMGQVLLDGVVLSAYRPVVLAQKRAVLPQQLGHTFNMTVGQLLELGFFAFPDLSPATANDLTLKALDQVAIDPAWASKPLMHLSGGQLQRVHIARTLAQCYASVHAQGQGWLLLDEPLANLDPLHQQQLLALCQNLVKTMNVGVLLVLHDLNIAAQWCDRLVLLGGGRVLSEGATATVLTEANLALAYGLGFHLLNVPIEGKPRTLVVPNGDH
jgi:iron complex transport system ATP-binding protein